MSAQARAQGHDQVALVVGASRGIGRQIAIDLAKEGYKVIIAAKSTSVVLPAAFPPDPNSSLSTITTVAHEIHIRGGTAYAIPCDVRSVASVAALVSAAGALYNRLDVVVYNSGAIWWASVANTPLKRFQLMQQVNPEGLYATIHSCLPWFARGDWQARVVVVCPPIYSRFFRGKTAYAIGKVGMSVLVKGLAMDWEREGKTQMAITGIWPAAAIQSGATRDVDDRGDLRKPEIFSDAILAMLRAPVGAVNGLLDTDEDFLRRQEGVRDFARYSLVEHRRPRRIMPKDFPDLKVAEHDDEGKRVESLEVRKRRERATKL